MTHTARPTRTLQIHVTRKCNLKCLHCYSKSGPDQTEMLPLEDLTRLIDDAATLGYSLITLSGGEPFLYPDMVPLLAHAKSLKLHTAVVTNGMFLDKRRLDELKPVLDLIAVSLDGAPDRHNYMRANPMAFAVMDKKLPALRASGIPFGFLFTLSNENAHEVDWAVDFALENGAALLQIHPLDMAGRALEVDEMDGMVPEQDTAITATKKASAAQTRVGDALRIVVDYQPRLIECEMPQGSCGREPSFADKVYPLCVETDGSIVPIGHGFSHDYKLGHIAKGHLSDMAQAWEADGTADRFADLVARTRALSNQPHAPELKNLAQEFRHASRGEERLGVPA